MIKTHCVGRDPYTNSTGFAHINRVANVARFIWVNMNQSYPEREIKGIAIKGKNFSLTQFGHIIKKYLLIYRYTLFQPDIY